MIDFKTELINLLETTVPALKDKIQAGAVDAQTKPPYAAYTTPEEIPIRTIHGIAGYTTTFEVSVYHSRISDVEQLKRDVARCLDSALLNSKRVYYKSGEYAFYADYGIHGYTLTFRII